MVQTPPASSANLQSFDSVEDENGKARCDSQLGRQGLDAQRQGLKRAIEVVEQDSSKVVVNQRVRNEHPLRKASDDEIHSFVSNVASGNVQFINHINKEDLPIMSSTKRSEFVARNQMAANVHFLHSIRRGQQRNTSLSSSQSSKAVDPSHVQYSPANSDSLARNPVMPQSSNDASTSIHSLNPGQRLNSASLDDPLTPTTTSDPTPASRNITDGPGDGEWHLGWPTNNIFSFNQLPSANSQFLQHTSNTATDHRLFPPPINKAPANHQFLHHSMNTPLFEHSDVQNKDSPRCETVEDTPRSSGSAFDSSAQGRSHEYTSYKQQVGLPNVQFLRTEIGKSEMTSDHSIPDYASRVRHPLPQAPRSNTGFLHDIASATVRSPQMLPQRSHSADAAQQQSMFTLQRKMAMQQQQRQQNMGFLHNIASTSISSKQEYGEPPRPGMRHMASDPLGSLSAPTPQEAPCQAPSANMVFLHKTPYNSVGSLDTRLDFVTKYPPLTIAQQHSAEFPLRKKHESAVVSSPVNDLTLSARLFNPFVYESLLDHTSLRLIRFEATPSVNCGDLCYTIISLDPWMEMKKDDPARPFFRYHCLSYCWGDSWKLRTIRLRASLDEATPYRSFSVTDNLHRALESLAESHTREWFWIDAISINQKDTNERTSQVSMMKNIYSRAASVVIWLGDSEAASSAYPIISHISDHFIADTGLHTSDIVDIGGLKLGQKHLDILKDHTTASVLSMKPMEAYEVLAEFFSLPWFRRVWVLQEAFSQTAITARLGKHSVPWGSIILAGLWQSFLARDYTASSQPSIRSSPQQNAGYLPELWLGLLHTRVPRGLSMIELVCRARDFHASDPRDKVFGLLGLANDIDADTKFINLRPDYTRSKTQVYTGFARDIIRKTGKLDSKFPRPM
jgi:hypothetical protein